MKKELVYWNERNWLLLWKWNFLTKYLTQTLKLSIRRFQKSSQSVCCIRRLTNPDGFRFSWLSLTWALTPQSLIRHCFPLLIWVYINCSSEEESGVTYVKVNPVSQQAYCHITHHMLFSRPVVCKMAVTSHTSIFNFHYPWQRKGSSEESSLNLTDYLWANIPERPLLSSPLFSIPLRSLPLVSATCDQVIYFFCSCLHTCFILYSSAFSSYLLPWFSSNVMMRSSLSAGLWYRSVDHLTS